MSACTRLPSTMLTALLLAALQPLPALAQSVEAEPNDSMDTATQVRPGDAVAGVSHSANARSDPDHYVLTLDETRRLQAEVVAEEGRFRLVLLDANGRERQRRDGNPVQLVDLVLEPGSHAFLVQGDANDPAASYRLSLTDLGAPVPGSEYEPNDDAEQGTLFDATTVVRGTFAGSEDDAWRIQVAGEDVQLWRVQASGSGIEFLRAFDASGREIARSPSEDGRSARLTNLLLTPGVHSLGLRGSNGNYLLRALPIGPAPGMPEARQPPVIPQALSGETVLWPIPRTDEVEPNDSLGRAMPLPLDTRRSALLDTPGDVDLYHFHLAAETRLSLQLERDAGLPVRLRISRGTPTAFIGDYRVPAEETAAIELLLQAGDHYLTVDSEAVSDNPYALTLARRPFHDRPADLEYNNDWFSATPLPVLHSIEGRLLQNDTDWYVLPAMPADTALRVQSGEGRSGNLNLSFRTEAAVDPEARWPARNSTALASGGNLRNGWTTVLPANMPVLLGVSGSAGSYALHFEADGMPAPPAPPPAPALRVGLSLEASRIAAFHRDAQRVTGSIQLENSSNQELSLQLATHAGDQRWSVGLAETTLRLPAGASRTLPLHVDIAPDAFDDGPVAIEVAAFHAGAAPGSAAVIAAASLEPLIDTLPVQAQAQWPLPEALRGGFNLAAAALGARAVYRADHLIDGLGNAGGSYTWSADQLRSGDPTVELAGTGPQRLAGITLLPPPDPDIGNWVRRFRLLASLDGESFRSVFESELAAMPGEQAFVFDAPVEARFLALRPLSSHARDGRVRAGIAELRAIGIPGAVPPVAGPLDIARHDLGGHIVRSDPYLPLQNALIDGAARASQTLPRAVDGPGFFVLGFASGRAAQIDAVVWRESDRASADTSFDSVAIAVSMDGASGPWEPLATLALPRTPDGEARLQLENPVWARYLRFEYQRRENQTRIELPARITVLERAVDEQYRSITAAWGEYAQDAIYEFINGSSQTLARADAPDSREQATLLAFDTEVHDSAIRGEDQDWRRIEIPEGGGNLLLELRNDPSVDVLLALQDAAGNAVPLLLDKEQIHRYHYSAWLEAGSYFLQVQEPPRSVALLWDSSGSVSSQVESIFGAVRSFARDLQPGREEVQFYPFSNRPPLALLDTWTGNPQTAYAALHAYDTRLADSSNAELNLAAAVRELEQRDGVRAVVLITDGLSAGENLSAELWASLDLVQPRIFSLAVSSERSGAEARALRDKMQDWAAVNGGFYGLLNGQQAIDVNFRRLAAWMRQPAPYSLRATLDSTPPAPARLRVRGDSQEERRADGAVEIILDASGSMLAQLSGRRRIDIAKEVLTGLVNDVLPDNVPFAMRVFGQGAPDSCDMNLQIPLATLDRQQASSAIAAIQPTNLARTPIAAALQAVAEDLREATGPRLIILLTDGEETCEGDPQASIESLRAAGFDVKVNIVGFAIEDAALAGSFAEWARLGGGTYFAAADSESLANAMDAALRRSYRVERANGEVMANGEINGAVLELPPGTYRLVFDDGAVIEGVQLAPGAAVELSAPESGAP